MKYLLILGILGEIGFLVERLEEKDEVGLMRVRTVMEQLLGLTSKWSI